MSMIQSATVNKRYTDYQLAPPNPQPHRPGPDENGVFLSRLAFGGPALGGYRLVAPESLGLADVAGVHEVDEDRPHRR